MRDLLLLGLCMATPIALLGGACAPAISLFDGSPGANSGDGGAGVGGMPSSTSSSPQDDDASGGGPNGGMGGRASGGGGMAAGGGGFGGIGQGGALGGFGGGIMCEPPGCAHDACTEGNPLEASCGACEAAVCAADDFCCTCLYDDICVDLVDMVCSSPCP